MRRITGVRPRSISPCAEASKAQVGETLGKTIHTRIEIASPFYRAEEYHQNYYLKKSLTYKYYRWRCGRNQTVEDIWGDDAYKGIPDS